MFVGLGPLVPLDLGVCELLVSDPPADCRLQIIIFIVGSNLPCSRVVGCVALQLNGPPTRPYSHAVQSKVL